MHWLTEQWLHANSQYLFWSSAWGEGVKDLLVLLLLGVVAKRLHSRVHAHLECHVEGCSAWGHPVHGSSLRACKPHHPHLDPAGHTVEHIAHVARHGHNATKEE